MELAFGRQEPNSIVEKYASRNLQLHFLAFHRKIEEGTAGCVRRPGAHAARAGIRRAVISVEAIGYVDAGLHGPTTAACEQHERECNGTHSDSHGRDLLTMVRGGGIPRDREE